MVSVQSNMQMHDELSALFSRNLTFNPELQAAIPREEPKHEPKQASQPIVYSISQHYTHSSHVRPSSEPPQNDSAVAESILRTHGIDPSALTPSQIQLFKVAELQQQMRLLELWSICPPSRGGDIPALAWSSTTVEQEEQLARIRYERQAEQQVMSLDGTPVQAGDGKWAQHNEPDPEPYMFSGYAELMRRESEREARSTQPRSVGSHFGNATNEASSYNHATDPVYMGSDYIQQQQMDMATQYGAFQQFRGVGESDAMDVM